MRKLVVGLLVPTAFAVALSACNSKPAGNTGGSGGSSPTSSPAPKPADLLAAAVQKTAGTNFKFTLGDASDHAEGVYDAASKGVSFNQTVDGEKMQLVIIGTDMYLSGMADLKGKIWHLDAKKLTAKSSFAIFADPLAALAFLSAAGSVTADTADGTLRGTFDPSKIAATSPSTTKVVDFLVDKRAGKTDPLPFTATVDKEGRLASFKMLFPGIGENDKDGAYELILSEYGTSATVTKPTKDVIEAPSVIYSS
jgi:hypothetical protein